MSLATVDINTNKSGRKGGKLKRSRAANSSKTSSAQSTRALQSLTLRGQETPSYNTTSCSEGQQQLSNPQQPRENWLFPTTTQTLISMQTLIITITDSYFQIRHPTHLRHSSFQLKCFIQLGSSVYGGSLQSSLMFENRYTTPVYEAKKKKPDQSLCSSTRQKRRVSLQEPSNDSGGKKIFSRQYYHPNPSCILKRHPYFKNKCLVSLTILFLLMYNVITLCKCFRSWAESLTFYHILKLTLVVCGNIVDINYKLIIHASRFWPIWVTEGEGPHHYGH